VLSASKELEPGTRAMLILAAGLFRLDIVVHGDTLRTSVRNLSSGPLQIASAAGTAGPRAYGLGEISAYEPGHASVQFALGDAGDRVTVTATMGTLRLKQRGTVRVTAQAIVRQLGE
jgi:hypothetical protein